MPNWAFLIVRVVVSLSFCALATWIGWKLGGKPWMLLGLVFSSPAFGVAIAKPLVELSHEGLGWLAAQPLKEWEGRYYEFAGVHVRIYEDRGELWFAAKDVITAIAIPANADSLLAVYPSGCKALDGLTCLAMPTLEKLLSAHPGPESGRFLLWARREVLGPWEKKRSALP
jgi:hypothetical protein